MCIRDRYLTNHHVGLFFKSIKIVIKFFQGSAEQPGIIPRVLGMVFKSTSSKLSTTNFLCPHQVMSTIELTRNEVLVIEDLKNKILSWNQVNYIIFCKQRKAPYFVLYNMFC